MKSIISLLISLFTYSAFGLECYEINFEDSPDRSPLAQAERKETWCYKPIQDSNFKTLIFNYDGKGISKNLGMVIGKNQNFLFYDQLFGKVRVVEQIGSKINPYQIPFSTSDLKNNKKISIFFTEEQNQEIEKMAHEMLSAKRKIVNLSKSPNLDAINDELQDEEVYLAKEILPSDGYWWPFRNVPLAKPENSPTRIYDLYVTKKTGKNPNSTNWELKTHSQEHIVWGGHCNGWVSSTILYGFFDKTLLFTPANGRSNLVIEPYQIQGLRAESSFCVKFAFYGNRFNKPGDNERDISPDLFHKTIKYYLKELGKPLALDRIATDPVDNSIFSGYKLVVRQESANKYFVTANMKTHYYSYNPVNTKKTATTKILTYQYYLFTDNNGVITGGQWDRESPNPDFLWAPLAQMNCGRENPNIDPQIVDEMVNTLPQVE